MPSADEPDSIGERALRRSSTSRREQATRRGELRGIRRPDLAGPSAASVLTARRAATPKFAASSVGATLRCPHTSRSVAGRTPEARGVPENVPSAHRARPVGNDPAAERECVRATSAGGRQLATENGTPTSHTSREGNRGSQRGFGAVIFERLANHDQTSTSGSALRDASKRAALDLETSRSPRSWVCRR